MPLRIKDIAEELNISPATVSLVLNNKPGISDETRQRILKFVEEKGYITNMLSKPAFKNNRNIRFVIYKKHGKVVSETPFFSELMEGIDKEAREEGYNVLVSYINEQDNTKMDVLRIIEETAPDGIMLLATEMVAEDLEAFKQLYLPMVLLDSNFENEHQVDIVIINNCQGTYEAVKYLTDCGHTEIGYLHSSVWINNFDERKEGFMNALNSRGMKFNKHYLLEVESTMEGAYNDVLNYLEVRSTLPTAFFADNDIIAFGAIKAFREKGINIPQDVSIIGFDDMPFCEMIDPALTTLRVFKQRMGRIAAKRLIERIEHNPEETIKVEVSTELVERKSVLNRF
ncbi:MAG TPA: LacI family transcriptional regulator [Firmicutes bacterium]|jgi:DNA-binding LacI/PurR family transcriptional regulator|nr:LacI family transcriptional regulator [Bacillota bacterium]